MSNALQEQLLKAGLATEKQINKENHSKRKKAKQQKKSKTKEVDESKLLAQKAAEEKRLRDIELNKQKEETAKQKAIVAQIKQLIEMNKISSGEGETAYNFEDNKIIKRLYVTDPQHDQISRGKLAIVNLNESYELVASQVAEKIKDRDASYIIVLNDSVAGDDLDDEYADYKIPDDLMW